VESGSFPGVFVYGTLKRGGRYHDALFDGPVHAVEAFTGGRLFHLAAGYPALQLPPSLILHLATGDPDVDGSAVASAERLLASRPPEPPRAGERSRGEWVCFADPETVLRRMDRLEVFRPRRRSLYQRVLAPVWPRDGGGPRPAWTYVQEEPRGTLVAGGEWQG
jgi:gamma-glutamylcyclotransferase (GGCT)/AIG2-like uncharacterized protein YtfP